MLNKTQYYEIIQPKLSFKLKIWECLLAATDIKRFTSSLFNIIAFELANMKRRAVVRTKY